MISVTLSTWRFNWFHYHQRKFCLKPLMKPLIHKNSAHHHLLQPHADDFVVPPQKHKYLTNKKTFLKKPFKADPPSTDSKKVSLDRSIHFYPKWEEKWRYKGKKSFNPFCCSSSHLIWFVNYCFVNLASFLLICISLSLHSGVVCIFIRARRYWEWRKHKDDRFSCFLFGRYFVWALFSVALYLLCEIPLRFSLINLKHGHLKYTKQNWNFSQGWNTRD